MPFIYWKSYPIAFLTILDAAADKDYKQGYEKKLKFLEKPMPRNLSLDSIRLLLFPNPGLLRILQDDLLFRCGAHAMASFSGHLVHQVVEERVDYRDSDQGQESGCDQSAYYGPRHGSTQFRSGANFKCQRQ